MNNPILSFLFKLWMLGIGIFWMVVLVFGPYILGIAVIWLIVYLFGQAQFVAAFAGDGRLSLGLCFSESEIGGSREKTF